MRENGPQLIEIEAEVSLREVAHLVTVVVGVAELLDVRAERDLLFHGAPEERRGHVGSRSLLLLREPLQLSAGTVQPIQ